MAEIPSVKANELLVSTSATGMIVRQGERYARVEAQPGKTFIADENGYITGDGPTATDVAGAQDAAVAAIDAAERAEAVADVLETITASAVLAFNFGPWVSDGTTTAFTLPLTAYGVSQINLAIDGVTQAHDQFTVSGTTLTLNAAVPAGSVIFGKAFFNAATSGVSADSVLMQPSSTLSDIMPLTRSLYASDGDFDTAATAIGWEFPTPYMTRFDLPPQSIDIMHTGVIPSNLLADAANNVLVIQDLIDWLSSKTNGGTIRGGSFHPDHTNPIIALRKATAQNYALMLKPKVSFEFGPGIRFRAAEAMETMVETAVDPTVDAATGRLSNINIRGGFWDAGRLADHCFRIREFEDINFGHAGMILHSALRSPLRLGDATRSKNSYGFYADNFKVSNANSAYGGAAVAAIESVHGFSDSHFNHLLLEGYPRGITGEIYISRMMDCHAWSYPDTQGPLYIGFDCSGGQNVYWGMQVDNPYTAAFNISGGDNYRFIGCTSTMDLSAVVDPGKPASGTIPVFRVDPALPITTTVVIEAGFGNDRVATTFSRMASFPAGCDVTVQDSYLRYGSVNQNIERGYRSTTANLTTVAGLAPIVNSSQNVGSVTRNGDADYTFVMTNGQPDTRYLIDVDFVPTSYPQLIIPVIRDKQASSFRIQFFDAAGVGVRPATISVSTKKV